MFIHCLIIIHKHCRADEFTLSLLLLSLYICSGEGGMVFFFFFGGGWEGVFFFLGINICFWDKRVFIMLTHFSGVPCLYVKFCVHLTCIKYRYYIH